MLEFWRKKVMHFKDFDKLQIFCLYMEFYLHYRSVQHWMNYKVNPMHK